MTLTGITLNLALIRGYEGAHFAEATDAQLETLKLDVARLDLDVDIRQRFGMDVTDATNFEQFLTDSTDAASRALTYRVLYLYFAEHDMGEGSPNRAKRDHYRSLYDKAVGQFTRRAGPRSGSVILTR